MDDYTDPRDAMPRMYKRQQEFGSESLHYYGRGKTLPLTNSIQRSRAQAQTKRSRTGLILLLLNAGLVLVAYYIFSVLMEKNLAAGLPNGINYTARFVLDGPRVYGSIQLNKVKSSSIVQTSASLTLELYLYNESGAKYLLADSVQTLHAFNGLSVDTNKKIYDFPLENARFRVFATELSDAAKGLDFLDLPQFLSTENEWTLEIWGTAELDKKTYTIRIPVDIL
jgi:hypothetical protein